MVGAKTGLSPRTDLRVSTRFEDGARGAEGTASNGGGEPERS